MGKGRKKQTLTLTENFPHHVPENCSAPARNLKKGDLGSVIFGCKHSTIRECYDKQLFGLPTPHFSYVRNVYSGLPLFLFNYSDRQLHGLFEAAGHGQLNIDKYAWSGDGYTDTSYPAQVKIKVCTRYRPLSEQQFGPLIDANYYERRLFWFELDVAQTRKLVALFKSSTSTSLPQNASRWTTIFQTTTLSMPRHGHEASTSADNSGPTANMGINEIAETEENKAAEIITCPGRSYASVLQNIETHIASIDLSDEGHKTSIIAGSSIASACQSDEEWNTSDGPGSTAESSMSENGETQNHSQEVARQDQDYGGSHLAANMTDTCHSGKTWSSLFQTRINPDAVQEVDHTQVLPNLPGSSPTEGIWGSVVSIDANQTEWYEQNYAQHSSTLSQMTEMGLEANNGGDTEWYEQNYAQHSSTLSQMTEMGLEANNGGDTEDVLSKLLREVEALRSYQSKQDLKISSLEQELGESKMKIQELNKMCKTFKTVSCTTVDSDTLYVDCGTPILDDSILILGGNDGSSWLSSVDLFSPSQDQINWLSSMTTARSYSSATKLNNEVYILGGADDDLWHGKVESYNVEKNQWFQHPSLNRRKGNLASISLGEKLYAIGGGNVIDRDCYSEVEMLDPDIGRWISVRSMEQKRFSPGAGDINGMLYVVGGYDGQDYLKSVEKFDPREHSWTRIQDMASRRGCHALVAHNEKLYAIGGFDGSEMVPDVEVFDPRFGSWNMTSPLNDARGYAAAVVVGDAIYVIGGLSENNEILDTVECYKEGHGWKRTDLRAVGKRCMFSAIAHETGGY